MKNYYQSKYNDNYIVKVVKGIGTTCYFSGIKHIAFYRKQHNLDKNFFRKISEQLFYQLVGNEFNISLPKQLEIEFLN